MVAFVGRAMLDYFLWLEEFPYITKKVLLDQCPAVLQNIVKCL